MYACFFALKHMCMHWVMLQYRRTCVCVGRREKGMGEKGMAQKVQKILKKSKFWKIDILAWTRKTRNSKKVNFLKNRHPGLDAEDQKS